MSLLRIEGLSHSFGENVLYRNAEFTLNKGEKIDHVLILLSQRHGFVMMKT